MSHPFIAVISSIVKEVYDQIRYQNYRGALGGIRSLFNLLKPEDKGANKNLLDDIKGIANRYKSPPPGSSLPMVRGRDMFQMDMSFEDEIQEVFSKMIDVLHNGNYLDNRMYEAEGLEIYKDPKRPRIPI